MEFSQQTTLITGASSGIGAAFAHAIAARGSDLVLVARRQDRLQTLATSIEQEHHVSVRVVPLDLSRPGAAEDLKAQADALGLRITSLVNSAGFGVHGDVIDADPRALSDLITVNITALVDVTRAFLPDLKAAGTGALINIASNAGYQPVPGMAAYSATKSFVLNFTEALWYEMKGTGLTVLSVAPGPTETEFFDVVGSMEVPRGGLQTPDQVVRATLRALARRNPPPSIVTGLGLTLQTTAVRFLPRRAAIRIASGATVAKPAA